mgnify:CR=1 FL=1
MIIYGTNSKRIEKRKINGEKCPNCESSKLFIIGEYIYVHVFWIPFFPTKKKIHPICQNCSIPIEKKTLSKKTIDKIKIKKKNIKPPFYLFSGLFLITFLISYTFYSNKQHKNKVSRNIKKLELKDVVVFKTKNNVYSYGKVISVSSDTVVFNFSNYFIEKRTPTESNYLSERIRLSDFYDTISYKLSQKIIDSLYLTGEIHDLYRYKK